MNQIKVKTMVLMVFLLLSITNLTSEEKPILTVLDLDASGISEGEMRGIISLLTSGLFKTDKYTVIDVSERDAVMNEIEFSLSGCSDEACQIELGKMLSAEFIVVGTIDPVGSRLVVAVKMLETATSRTVSTADGIYENLDTLIDDLYGLAARLAGVEAEPAVAEAPAEPQEVIEEPVPQPAPETTDEPQKEPVNIGKIINYSGIGVGAVSAGVGGYLLYTALSFLNGEVEDSFNIYDTLPEGTAQSTVDDAYSTYLDNFDLFTSDLIIGSAVAGGGLIIAGVFTYLLLSSADEPDVSAVDNGRMIALYDPGPRAVTLGYSMNIK